MTFFLLRYPAPPQSPVHSLPVYVHVRSCAGPLSHIWLESARRQHGLSSSVTLSSPNFLKHKVFISLNLELLVSTGVADMCTQLTHSTRVPNSGPSARSAQGSHCGSQMVTSFYVGNFRLPRTLNPYIFHKELKVTIKTRKLNTTRDT